MHQQKQTKRFFHNKFRLVIRFKVQGGVVTALFLCLKICQKRTSILLLQPVRGVAQLGLEYASGGRGVGGSNPLTPTRLKA